MKLAIEAFNRGEIPQVLQYFTNDVKILIPIYGVDETAGDMRMSGRVQLRRLLERRLATGIPIRVRSYCHTETGAIITLNSSVRGEVAVTVRFDEDGLASHLSIFKT